MYKNDQYYIDRIRENLIFIMDHMKDVSQEKLEEEPVLQDSMMFRLIQVSESAKNLTEDYLEKNPQIPWTDIFGLRNRIIHDYGNVKLKIVYDTLTKDVPDLLKMLTENSR